MPLLLSSSLRQGYKYQYYYWIGITALVLLSFAFLKLEKDLVAGSTTLSSSSKNTTTTLSSTTTDIHDSSTTNKEIKGKKNLLVMNALGRKESLPHMVHARTQHMPDWICLAFMYVNESIIPDDNADMIALRAAHCTIVRTPNVQWGNFLQSLPPALVDTFDHVAILLDDIFLPDRGPRPVNVTQLLYTMHQYQIDSIQPAVRGDGWLVNPNFGQRARFLDCLVAVPMIETFFQIFTRTAWQCYYDMLHYKYGRGFCLDLCFRQYCNVTLATDFSMLAYHLEKAQALIPPAAMAGTNLTFHPVVRIDNGFYLPKGQKPNGGQGCFMGQRKCPGFKHPLPIRGTLHCP